jgi:MFS family permease
MRNRVALLVALGVDNFGSGLFLPLTLVYVIRVVGLPLAAAGPAVSLGTIAGLAVPAVAGRLVDRLGPRRVVITAELLQAAGAAAYLVARDVPAVVVAAVLLGAGQQLFYSSLVALVADVAGAGLKDHPLAVASMVRSGAFGLGGLGAGAALAAAGTAAYRVAVAGDAASFVVCALGLILFVRLPGPGRQAPGEREPAPERPAPVGRPLLGNRPFLALILVASPVVLGADVFLTGMPVYVLDRLHAPGWLPGVLVAVLTAVGAAVGTVALRLTRRLSRIGAMQLGAGLGGAWAAASLAAVLIPPGWRPAELIAATLLLAAAGLVFTPRALALAEAAAPAARRGSYLAAFQYAFTVAGVLAPAIASLYAVAVWLPWLITGGSALLAIPALGALARYLPPGAVRPGSF